jgi:hypothetical protein
LEEGADGVALWLTNASEFVSLILNRAAKRAFVFSGRKQSITKVGISRRQEMLCLR